MAWTPPSLNPKKVKFAQVSSQLAFLKGDEIQMCDESAAGAKESTPARTHGYIMSHISKV